MKKLIMIVAALAMTFGFLAGAEAADTANLGLSVTFALEPLTLVAEPTGPFFIYEGDEVTFKVIAEDLDAQSVTLSTGTLPEGATFVLVDTLVPANHMEGTFTWTPVAGQTQGSPYKVEFFATSENEVTAQGIDINITVMPLPVISIEINPATWAFDGVKLGEKKGGVFYIANTGNVAVLTDIGYGPQEPGSTVVPGLAQGLNTFITEEITHTDLVPPHDVMVRVLPPDKRMKLMSINPSESAPLELVYGAPTALSAGIANHAVIYEIRAYGDVGTDPLEPGTGAE